MYRFVWAPKWILSHLLVLTLVVTMIGLGMWQLRRLDERQARNMSIEERSGGEPAAFSSSVTAEMSGDEIEELDYSNMTVTGSYDTSREFVVINRSLDGVAGRWLLTPLEPSDGSPEVLVLRGFVTQAMQDTSGPFEGFEPPEGEVTVEGWAHPGRKAEGLQSSDSHLESGEWTRVDIDQFADEEGSAVAPMYLQLYAQDPVPRETGLRPVPLPELDEGPHLGYAGQWAIFTLIALIGYPLILRKVARERRNPPPGSVPDGESESSSGSVGEARVDA